MDEGVLVLLRGWREKKLTTEGTEYTETDTEEIKNTGCPDVGSLLVDFGLAPVVASVARASFCGLRPKVVAQRTKGTTGCFSNQGFPRSTRKNHATLATSATTTATESP